MGLAAVLSSGFAFAAARSAASVASHAEAATGQATAAGNSRGTDPARPQPRDGGGHRQARVRCAMVRAVSAPLSLTMCPRHSIYFAARPSIFERPSTAIDVPDDSKHHLCGILYRTTAHGARTVFIYRPNGERCMQHPRTALCCHCVCLRVVFSTWMLMQASAERPSLASRGTWGKTNCGSTSLSRRSGVLKPQQSECRMAA